MMKDWFYDNIYKPVQKFYHKHILREADWSDNTYSSTQENLDHLATHIPPSDHDLL